MAQNRTIKDILQELHKDYKTVLLRAVEQATDTACKDVYKFSMSVLERYYESYIPSRYDRTDNLWRAATPIAKVEDRGNIIVGTYGVEYDPSVLDGIYDGSKKYGSPDGSWILENYLMGIHPATNGSSDPDTVVYVPWQDARSPDEYLTTYLRMYKKKFENNVNDYLIKYITK